MLSNTFQNAIKPSVTVIFLLLELNEWDWCHGAFTVYTSKVIQVNDCISRINTVADVFFFCFFSNTPDKVTWPGCCSQWCSWDCHVSWEDITLHKIQKNKHTVAMLVRKTWKTTLIRGFLALHFITVCVSGRPITTNSIYLKELKTRSSVQYQ